MRNPLIVSPIFVLHTKKIYTCFLATAFTFIANFTLAQQYDLLLKGGHVIDAKNNINAIKDIAIKDGKIAEVNDNISTSTSKKTIDATGLYVVPGLIDIHTHVFVGNKANTFADGVNSVSPDDFSFKAGVTTVVDAGTSGWHNFPQFKSQVIDVSQTRILAFLNIAADGMDGKPVKDDFSNINIDSTVSSIQQNKDILVGVKIGHYEGADWTPYNSALNAATKSNTPLFVECHLPQYSLEEQLSKMRSGDIITHSFEEITERMPIVDSMGRLRPFVEAAQSKGVLFDVGHGGAGFWFNQAIPAFQQGLIPNTFGSDLHRFSMNAGMKNMLNIMSKYMAIGMKLDEVIAHATWNAAKAIKHEDLGNLSEGSVADITLLSIQKGKFGFIDAAGNKLAGKQKLEAELTIRGGKIVWDLNGISAKTWKKE